MSKSLLDLYTDYLISSFDQTAATALSPLFGGEISHGNLEENAINFLHYDED